MKGIHFVARLLLASLCAWGASAHAIPITYTFTGTTSYLSWPNGTPRPFDGQSPLSQSALGSFTFDADLTDAQPTSDSRTLYRASSAAWASFNLSVPDFAPLGQYATSGDCTNPYSYVVATDNDPNAGFPSSPGPLTDEWVVSIRCTEQVADGLSIERSMYLELTDWNPSGAPDLTSGLDPAQVIDWTLASNVLGLSIGYALIDNNCATCLYGLRESWTVGIDLDSLTRSSANVPEPATAMLLGVGLAGCLVARRRRRSGASAAP